MNTQNPPVLTDTPQSAGLTVLQPDPLKNLLSKLTPAMALPLLAGWVVGNGGFTLGKGAVIGGPTGGGTSGGGAKQPTPVPDDLIKSFAGASRFLSQASTGATIDDIYTVSTLGRENWIEQQFKTKRRPTRVFDWMIQNNDGPLTIDTTGADEAIWNSLIASEDTLRQRTAFALSQIFVMNFWMAGGFWCWFGGAAYFDLLLDHAFGNFRDLLEAVTKNPMMGRYLTYINNQKGDPARGTVPDENYAREVMQLFTIGLCELNLDGTPKRGPDGKPIPTYGQSDVMGLAKVFTGWVLSVDPFNVESVRLPMRQDASLHDFTEKKFLGVTIPAGTQGDISLKLAIDRLFNHPNVGPFIGRQLIQRFVCSNPSPAYVARVASAFNNNGRGVRGDLKAVIRAILLDDEARIPQKGPFVGKLREPVLRFTQWARAFKAKSPDGKWVVGRTMDVASGLAQSPLRAPSVFNFFRPGYVPPNTAMAANAITAPEFQIVDEVSVAGYLNYMRRMVFNENASVQADYSEVLQYAKTPEALVRILNVTLAGEQVSEANVTRIVKAISTLDASKVEGQLNRVKAAVMMILASPEYITLV